MRNLEGFVLLVWSCCCCVCLIVCLFYSLVCFETMCSLGWHGTSYVAQAVSQVSCLHLSCTCIRGVSHHAQTQDFYIYMISLNGKFQEAETISLSLFLVNINHHQKYVGQLLKLLLGALFLTPRALKKQQKTVSSTENLTVVQPSSETFLPAVYGDKIRDRGTFIPKRDVSIKFLLLELKEPPWKRRKRECKNQKA